MGAGFFKLSERAQAKEIGCHWGTWTRTEFFKTAERMRAPRAPKNPSSPKTVSLTHELEAVTGEGGRDEVLNRLVAEQKETASRVRLKTTHPEGKEKSTQESVYQRSRPFRERSQHKSPRRRSNFRHFSVSAAYR